MKKKWNLLFLFAFIVSMITLAGCGKTAGEASPYEGKWIAVSAQMIGMSVSVDETFGGAFEFEVKWRKSFFFSRRSYRKWKMVCKR